MVDMPPRHSASRSGFLPCLRNRKDKRIVILILCILSLSGVLLFSTPANDTEKVLSTARAVIGNTHSFAKLWVNESALRMSKSHVALKLGVSKVEKHHVFFLKVHKAASTTVQNVLLRFALSRRLKVMLPISGVILSQDSKSWLSRALPVPKGVPYFDILCNHLVYDEDQVRARLYPDSVFVGVVRHPFRQFVSAFTYYREKWRLQYLWQIRSGDPISTYLKDPSRWEPGDVGVSYTNNRMSFDFGLDPGRMRDQSYVANYIQYLDKTFHLVLISERFDESMVLMMRYLGWTFKDVLYIKNNVYKKDTKNFTQEEKRNHRAFNMADYALYEHFYDLFDKRVEAEGSEFVEEVKMYTSVRKTVEEFCRNSGAGVNNLTVTASYWNDELQVSRNDCNLMEMSETSFVKLVRSKLL